MSTALVTGGSGFVGGHIILQLLAAGQDVRTTVRSLKREDMVRATLASPAVAFSRRTRRFRKSSIFLRRIVGVMFMRVKSKCAHQARPPLAERGGHPSDRTDGSFPNHQVPLQGLYCPGVMNVTWRSARER
jgi:hypothetical protein